MAYQDNYLSIDEQINELEKRKLIISNRHFARSILETNNYTSLIRYYGKMFQVEPDREDSEYIDGTTLEDIYSLYSFNAKISSLYLEYILIVEHVLRAVISDCFAKEYNPIAYLDKSNFVKYSGRRDNTARLESLMTKINTTIDEVFESKKNDASSPFKRYIDTGDKSKIPIWLLVNAMSFGTLRNFYNCLNNSLQSVICSKLKIDPKALETAFAYLNQFRNSCAHGERIYDFYNKRKFYLNQKDELTSYYGVYAVTKILKLLLSSDQFLEFYTRLNECFSELEVTLDALYIEKIKQSMRFPHSDEILFKEMGSFANGIVLSQDEFVEVLVHYIMPLLPQGKLDLITKDDFSREKRKSLLVEYDENESRVYFSQSINSNYSVRTMPLKNVLGTDTIEIMSVHLSELMSNLQIIWNTRKAAALRTREQRLLFKTDMEIAYQLSLCSLLCNRFSQEKKKQFYQGKNELRKQYQETPKEDCEAKNKIKQKIALLEKKFRPVLDQERLQRETVYCVLSYLDQWAQKTYEGRHVPFGIIINGQLSTETTFDYIDFLSQNYSATISDGVYSCVEIYADGQYCKHIPICHSEKVLHPIPYPHQGFAQVCGEGKIGILLTDESDIIVVSEHRLFCSKHNGRWTYNLYEKAFEIIKEQLDGISDLSKREYAVFQILQTLIDVSYSHGGACIAIADDVYPNPQLLRMTYPTLLDPDEREIVENDSALAGSIPLTEAEKEVDSFRIAALRALAGRDKTFPEMNPYLRRELIEMDGALILGADGIIHAIASIVNTNGASVMSGARTTAAVRLSKYGLAIKVSQDGYMKFYKNGEEILSI